jgi:hypothetical protein
MGNSILPVTNEYSEHNLEFTDDDSNEELIQTENSDYTKLEQRIEQIEETTLSNLKLLSDDIHHLYELFNKLKLVINPQPPIIT